MLGIKITRLQLIREVARRGTIRAAAEAMHITPSAASQQLSALERESGLALFERRGRSVVLTEAGQRVARHAGTVAAAIAAAESDLALLRGEVTGIFRMAAIPTASRALMPSVVSSTIREHRQLRLTLRDLGTRDSLSALERDEIDVAIVDAYEGDAPLSGTLATVPILRDPILMLLPPDRGHGRTVRLQEFRDDYWIMDTEDSRLYEVTVRACRTAGFDPQIRSETTDFAVIIALVQAGLGIALVPGLAIRGLDIDASICRPEPSLGRDVFAAYRVTRRAHPVVASVVNAIETWTRSVTHSGVDF